MVGEEIGFGAVHIQSCGSFLASKAEAQSVHRTRNPLRKGTDAAGGEVDAQGKCIGAMLALYPDI
jgi:hypothetical protein